jgi:hypothetical protein
VTLRRISRLASTARFEGSSERMRARPLLTVYISTRTRFRPHGIIAYRPFQVIVAMIAMNRTLRRVKRSGMDAAI